MAVVVVFNGPTLQTETKNSFDTEKYCDKHRLTSLRRQAKTKSRIKPKKLPKLVRFAVNPAETHMVAVKFLFFLLLKHRAQ